jgi:hypothetical protein
MNQMFIVINQEVPNSIHLENNQDHYKNHNIYQNRFKKNQINLINI